MHITQLASTPVARPESISITAKDMAEHPQEVQAMLAALAPVNPSDEVFQRNAQDIFSVPGVAGISWMRDKPDSLDIYFADAAFRELASTVLNDTVDGVKLLSNVVEGAPPVNEMPWWTHSSIQQGLAVRAMPGVVSSGTSIEHGLYEMIFQVKDQAVIDRLKPLVRPQIDKWRTVWIKAI